MRSTMQKIRDNPERDIECEKVLDRAQPPPIAFPDAPPIGDFVPRKPQSILVSDFSQLGGRGVRAPARPVCA
jgi:hypothetical protein